MAGLEDLFSLYSKNKSLEDYANALSQSGAFTDNSLQGTDEYLAKARELQNRKAEALAQSQNADMPLLMSAFARGLGALTQKQDPTQAAFSEAQNIQSQRRQRVIDELGKNDFELSALAQRQKALQDQSKQKMDLAKELLGTRMKENAETAKDIRQQRALEAADQRLQSKLDAQIGGKSSAQYEYKSLPVENQEQIKDLAKANANKIDIKNAIDSSVAKMDDPTISEDQKIVLGKSLLKTLNSQQGKDAIGSEEAHRLGSFLEYKLFNYKEPGSFMGRDLGEFIQQAKINSASLGETIEKNASRINQLYGRASSESQTLKASPVGRGITPEDLEAADFIKNNPNHPSAAAIKQKLVSKGMRI